MSLVRVIALIDAFALPAVATIAGKLLERQAWFRRLSFWPQALLISVVFAVVAALEAAIGFPVEGGIATIALCAPVCVAINFDWPCGVLTGAMAAAWLGCTGLDQTFELAQLAGPLAMLNAGLGMSVLRYRQDNAPLGILTSHVAAYVSQALYWSLFLGLRQQDLREGYLFVLNSMAPAIVGTVVAVNCAWAAGRHMDGRALFITGKERALKDVLSIRLFSAVIVAFAVAVVSALVVTGNFCKNNADSTLRTSLKSAMSSVDHSVDLALSRKAIHYAPVILKGADTDAELKDLIAATEVTDTPDAKMVQYGQGLEADVAEVAIADANGIITESSNPDALGFDLTADGRTAEFMDALETGETHVEELTSMPWDENAEIKYVGVPADGQLVLVGFCGDAYEEEIAHQIPATTRHVPVGHAGSIVVVGRDGTLVSAPDQFSDERVAAEIPARITGVGEFEARGTDSEAMYAGYHDYYFLALYPRSEISLLRDIITLDIPLMMTIVFSALFFFVRTNDDRIIVQRIQALGATLGSITDGDLTARAEVRGIAEFSELSNDINKTVDSLESLIEEAKNQYAKDLETAHIIQRSALPSVFPPYPKRKEFSLFASMDAAREVGGDFYDYFFIDAHRLAILVADVSDKGIPASLFMMTSKTLIHNLARTGKGVDQVAAEANDELCNNNQADMFVTVWLGVLDLRSGHMNFVNAGHTVPCVYRTTGDGNGSFSFIEQRRNLFLGGVEGTKYLRQEIDLSPGDTIFLYSDGVTEATDTDEDVFGNDRLLASLNRRIGQSVEEICGGVKQDVLDFTGEAEQFDDITVLALTYHAREESYATNVQQRITSELSIQTTADAVDEVMRFVKNTLKRAGCAEELIDKTCLVVDEIVSNVVYYAYDGEVGWLTLKLETEKSGSWVRLAFSDSGKAFDPLENPEPDVSLSLDERPIGGLGIFLTKTFCDELSYDRVDDLNVLTATISQQ